MWLVYASTAAVCFGLRGVLYQWTSQKPLNRNLMLLGVYVSGSLTSLFINLFAGQAWTIGTLTGFIMGIFSITSNAAFYKGFSVGKASLVAVFSGLAPVVVACGAFLLWGETLKPGQTASFLIILAGIVCIRYSDDLSLSNLKGVQWALLAMLFFGLTDISTKQSTIWHAETLPTLTVMYGTGAILSALLAAKDIRSQQAREMSEQGLEGRIHTAEAEAAAGGVAVAAVSTEAEAVVAVAAAGTGQPVAQNWGLIESKTISGGSVALDRGTSDSESGKGGMTMLNRGTTETVASAGGSVPRDLSDIRTSGSVKNWSYRRTILWGMVVGFSNISGMMLIIPAFRLGVTGLVSAVIALNVLIILLYARVFLKEKFRKLEIVGMSLAFAGIIILKLLG